MVRRMNNSSISKGAILPILVRLSVPVLAGQLFNLLYSLVDTWFIARIDPSDPWLVGSTGLVFPLFFIFLAASFGITGGVSSLVARAIGAGRSSELDRTAESGMFLALVASAIILVGMYAFATPLLKLFGGVGKILEYGRQYLVWLLPTVPFMLLSAVFTGILQGEGRTKHMMAAMMVGTVANVALDPLLIFVAGMGVAGAGLATAIGNAAGLVYLIAVFSRPGSSVEIHWKPSNVSLPVVGEILRVGLPQSVLNFLASISFIFYNRVMTDIDPIILTSFTLYSRLEQIALIPCWSISSALSTVAGQAAGAGDLRRMRDSSRTATVLTVAVCGSLLLGYVLSSQALFRLFQTDAGVLARAAVITPWMAGSTLFALPFFMVTTLLSTSGFSGRSLALTAVRIYAFNVPACVLGGYVFGKSIESIMIVIFLSQFPALALANFARARFFSGLASGKIAVRVAARAPSGETGAV